MRKMIIDTDCGSDDAVALLIACLDKDTELLGITTTFGNIDLNLATKNTLQTVEVAGRKDVPVYMGSDKPLYRDRVDATNVHGTDGMGDLNLINPTKKAEDKNAVDFILESIKKYPNEIELVTLGPVSNIGRCIQKDKETMNKLKRIISMATSGLGFGNTTPVSEFNVYADAEAFKMLIELDVPKLFVGFDMCLGDAAWSKEDIEEIDKEGTLGAWSVAVNNGLLKYNLGFNLYRLELPDAVAMACVCWPETVIEALDCYSYCCVSEEATYGQVIFYNENMVLSADIKYPPYNCKLVTKFDGPLYIKKCKEALIQKIV